ncbi:hypothetical protein BGX38DRAFT_93692 [Terfezia claveryi]|nr:hypothetical protein BGX38DRAFT_93692 [Terfezia claveryi]
MLVIMSFFFFGFFSSVESVLLHGADGINVLRGGGGLKTKFCLISLCPMCWNSDFDRTLVNYCEGLKASHSLDREVWGFCDFTHIYRRNS